MQQYFGTFPSLKMDVFNEGKEKVIVNIMQKVNIDSKLKEITEVFLDYSVSEGETPELISNKIYGSPFYHWIILLMNDIYNPYYDWPITSEEIERLLIKKYGDGNQNNPHHYVDYKGNIVDEYNQNASPVSNREYETVVNDSKRKIKILDPKYLSLAESELSDLMAQ